MPKGLNFLPTTRLLGVVKVDTGAEALWIDDAARPEGTAQPLVDCHNATVIQNRAYTQVRDAVPRSTSMPCGGGAS